MAVRTGERINKLPITVGETYGVWKVLSFEGVRDRYGNGRTDRYWTCQCQNCGITCSRTTAVLKGKWKGCRCGLVVEDASFHRAYRTYKRQARTRNLKFELSLEEFKNIVIQPCFYCGQLPVLNSYSSDSKIRIPMNGIDRRKSDQSYTPENCIPCCGTCNLAKLDHAEQDFVSWTIKVAEFQHTKLIHGISKEPATVHYGKPKPEDEWLSELEGDSE